MDKLVPELVVYEQLSKHDIVTYSNVLCHHSAHKKTSLAIKGEVRLT